MKFKNALYCLLITNTLLSSNVFAQDLAKIDELKKKIIGTWRFDHYYSINDADAARKPDDCTFSMKYTFKENSTVEIKNSDSTKCKYGNEVKSWSIVSLHDDRGKDRYAIRIVEDGIGPRQSYDGNTFTDEILMISMIKKNFLLWIPKTQYKPASFNDLHLYYFKD